MPFDISGNFSRVYDFETDRNNGIAIMAARVDGEFDGVAVALSQTFVRDGRAAMTGTLRLGSNGIAGLADGTLATPAIGFSGESNTGIYRPSAGKLGVDIQGTQRLEVNTTGVSITGNLVVSGSITAGSIVGAVVTGPVTTSGLTMNTGKLLARTTAATGAIEEITPGATIVLAGGILSVAQTPQALTFNNGGAGDASGTTFNGGTARTLSYNSIGATRAGAITSGDLTIATSRLAGRTTAATGAVEEISVGGTLTLSGGSLSVASVPNAFTFNNGGAGDASGTTYNGSAARTLSYNSLGAAPLASPTFTGTPAAPLAGTGTNTTQLATTSFVQQELARSAKRTLPVMAGAMTPRAGASPCADPATTLLVTNNVIYKSIDFDPATAEFAQFAVPMPKWWDESTVTFDVLWTAAAGTVAQSAIFGLAGVAISNDDPLDVAFGAEVTVTDALLALSDLHVSPVSGNLTIGGTPQAEDMVIFQLRRDAANGSDTLTGDAKVIGVRIYYNTNARDDA